MADAARPLLLSVALDVPPRPSSDFFGHEVVYQHALVQAAQRQGIEAAIAVPYATWADHPDVVCLLGTGDGSWVDGLRRELHGLDGRDCTVLFYEGSLQLLEVVASLAGEYPVVRFVVNLFRSDEVLAWPHLSQRYFGRRMHLGPVSGLDDGISDLAASVRSQPNIVLLADTERRRLLAESLGFRAVATWPLYSVVSANGESARERTSCPAFRVVVPVAYWQVTRQLAYEVAIVVRLVKRYAGPDLSFSWLVVGAGYEANAALRSRRRRMSRLQRLSVDFRPGGVDVDEYRSMLTEADLVWLPQRGFYTTQSSGKAADALVCGTPILAPNGSFAAQEMARWVPGAPGYTGAREAAEVLLRAATIVPALRASLSVRSADIQEWYSPERAVRLVRRPPEESATAAGGPVKPATRPAPAQHLQGSSQGTDHGESSLSKLRRFVRNLTPQLAADLFELWVRIRTLLRLR